jgi:arylsulfatase A-like enzyme
MPNRYAIVIAVDGLRASALGAYGNTWHPTPALDRLASESLVFDWLIADSPELAGFYRAAWFGIETPRDGVERELTQLGDVPSLARRLESAGIQAALTTDDQWVAEQADQLGFGEVRGLEFPEPASADAVADTEFAQLFAVAADQIESWSAADADAATDAPPRLLWLHARGYHGAWDAPTELRQSLLDEEDPPALEFVAPPTRLETNDHDELLLHRSAYAAQTIVLDQCVGMLLETLDAAGLTDSTLVALVGCRGFALGEHGALGSGVRDLYGELTHIPLIVRRPGSDSVPPPRSSELVQPIDLLSSLLSWFNLAAEPGAGRNLLATDDAGIQPVREVAYASGAVGEIALRTHSWWMRQSESLGKDGDAAGSVELFSKPDDRWEANEIADRCPNEAAAMLALADEFRSGEPDSL